MKSTSILTLAFALTVCGYAVLTGCEKSNSPYEESKQPEANMDAQEKQAEKTMENLSESGSQSIEEMQDAMNIYSFELKNIEGEPTALSGYKGKVMLVVNVASKCGYTRQYEGLQELYQRYKDRGLVILGFPANNFGKQEPGSDEQIKQFCTQNYGVTFPMFSKISVKGEDMHPLYAYLTETTGKEIQWNFNKFLVGRNGEVIRKFESGVEPLSEELTVEIEKLL